MSSVVDFRLIETSKLNQLRDHAEIKVEKKLFSKKVIDNYTNYHHSNSKEIIDFRYSGHIFASLLPYLEEKGIDLANGPYGSIANFISEKRQNYTIILSHHERQAYLDQLSPEKFTMNELVAFNTDFSNDPDPELATAQLAGIRTLHDCLMQLTDDSHVVVVSIG
jgi:hypothetical protein